MFDENEAIAVAMFEAESKIDGNILGWEEQPPVYKRRVLAMARAAILEMRVQGIRKAEAKRPPTLSLWWAPVFLAAAIAMAYWR